MVLEAEVQSQVESYQRLKKWYLMPPCLTLSIIRYESRVKWHNPGKGVAPSPTPQCNSFENEALRSPLNKLANLTFYQHELLSQLDFNSHIFNGLDAS